MWRDAGDWERFATVWHPQGRMMASWFQASAPDFIARSRAAWDKGMNVVHVLGGSTIEVAGVRATSETRMQIIQRAPVHGIDVEVNCHGRFIDAFEKISVGWRLMRRQVAYEMDRMMPLDPTVTLQLDRELLASFPEGYRHLAYLQTQQGFDVDRDLPGSRGRRIEQVRSDDRLWLADGQAA